jgi:CRP-like cAMP-binding protein
MQRVRLPRKLVLHRPGEPIAWVYFPLNGVCSAVSMIEDGSTVEVDTVGRDGLVGLSLYFGSDTTPFQVFSQIPGEAS